MSHASDATPNANPEPDLFEAPPIIPNGTDPTPFTDAENAKMKKARTKMEKAEKEGRPPLPEGTQPAPEIPIQAKAAPRFDEDLIADDDESERSEEVPITGLKIRTRLPKAKYLRVMPGKGIVVYAIRLGEEDRRPNQNDTFVLDKSLVTYFRDDLNQTIVKMIARVFTILQGQPRFLLHPASSELSGNSWNTSRRALLLDAETTWVMPRADMTAGCYRWRKRDATLAPVEPNYPIDPFIANDDGGSLFKRSLIRDGMLVATKDHRICKRLRGEEEEENAET
jgi:hypothetical protein